MNDKYSLAKCEQYGRRLAAKLCDQHFGSQPDAVLDGPAVLKFTPVRQINLLVVRQLLSQWQAETARLRSPFFDFEAAPVQAALTQFMNVLSRHIRLGRAAYETLLANAAAATLGIVADPVQAFQTLLLDNAHAPTLAGLRDNLRYLDVDKAFFQGFVDSVPTTGDLTSDFLQRRFELYHAANYKAHQPMHRLVAELSALLPLTEADLREDGPVSPVVAPPVHSIVTPAAPTPQALEVPVFASSMRPPAPSGLPSAEALATHAPPQAPALLLPSTPEPASANEEASVPLHEKLKAANPTASPLAATLRSSQHAEGASAPLAARSAPKVESLREAISINQRFSFINELFNGENMEYHAAVQHLDSLPNAEQAVQYITSTLAPRYDWARKEEHMNKLLKLVERKFA